MIEALAERARVPLSIDTRNALVMRRAAQAGARLINDVSALAHDPDSLAAAAETGVPVVLMHAQGEPRTMQRGPRYADVVLDVYDWPGSPHRGLRAGRHRARAPRSSIPASASARRWRTTWRCWARLSIFHGLGCPLMLGASRKSFIGKLTGAGAEERLPGSLAAALLGAAQGVQILRVHDVAATRQALAVWEGAHGGIPGL